MAKLKIISGILGIPLGTLTKRDQAFQLARAKRRARVVGAVAAALGLLAVAAVIASVVAWRKEREATRARNTAENLIQQMVFDLRDKLMPIGRLDLLDDVSAAAEQYFADFPAAAGDGEAEYQRAVLFNNRGSVLMGQGQLEDAGQALENALAIFRRRSLAEPENPVYRYDAANTLTKLGGIASNQGDLPKTVRLLREAEGLLADLGIDETGAKRYARGDLDVQVGLGNALFAGGDLEGARSAFEQAAMISGHVLPADNYAAQSEAGNIVASLASVRLAKGDFVVAVGVYEELLAALRHSSDLAPSSALLKSDLAYVLLEVGKAWQHVGMDAESVAAFEESLALVERLAQDDPEDTNLQLSIAGASDLLRDALREAGDLAGARRPRRRSNPGWVIPKSAVDGAFRRRTGHTSGASVRR